MYDIIHYLEITYLPSYSIFCLKEVIHIITSRKLPYVKRTASEIQCGSFEKLDL